MHTADDRVTDGRIAVRGLTKKDTPENLWVKCPDTGEMLYRPDLEAALWVTPSGNHMRIGSKLRLDYTFDDGFRGARRWR